MTQPDPYGTVDMLTLLTEWEFVALTPSGNVDHYLWTMHTTAAGAPALTGPMVDAIAYLPGLRVTRAGETVYEGKPDQLPDLHRLLPEQLRPPMPEQDPDAARDEILVTFDDAQGGGE